MNADRPGSVPASHRSVAPTSDWPGVAEVAEQFGWHVVGVAKRWQFQEDWTVEKTCAEVGAAATAQAALIGDALASAASMSLSVWEVTQRAIRPDEPSQDVLSCPTEETNTDRGESHARRGAGRCKVDLPAAEGETPTPVGSKHLTDRRAPIDPSTARKGTMIDNRTPKARLAFTGRRALLKMAKNSRDPRQRLAAEALLDRGESPKRLAKRLTK
jgi:hypothetical protein